MTRAAASLTEAREVIVQQELDALVLLFDGMHSFLEPNPVFDLTQFKSLDACAAVIDGERVSLLLAPGWDAQRARNSAVGVTRVIGCDDVAAELAKLLADSGSGRRIGAVGLGEMPLRYGEALRAIGETLSVDSEITRERAKSEDELARAVRAAAVADQAYQHLLDGAGPGDAEYELAARLDEDVTRLGGDDNFLLISSGPAGAPVRAPTTRRLEAGDVLNAEISPSYEGQFVQICRTAVAGRATAAQREDYELLVTALGAGMAAAMPGVTVGELVAAMDAPIVEAGYGEYCKPPHIRVRGHGQGLASVSPGDIVAESDVVLEEGMMFVLHPNQPTPRSGYMMCGEPIVVTPSGGRALTARRPGLDELGER